MSVILTMEVVNTLVLILLVAIAAPVMLATHLILMKEDVHVTILSLYCIIYHFTVAVCDDSCHHCITCDSPNSCTCLNGWTGSNCCTGIVYS